MKSFFSISLLLLVQILLGQNPYFNKIDKSQGLLTNSVYDIFQDKNDFMWFATEKGLCRFNGYSFHYFSEEDMTAKAGSCIQQDRYGRIWYENFDGYLYYVENNELKKLNQNKSVGYFKYGIIKNQLYIINEGVLDVYDLENLRLKKRIPLNSKEIKYIFFADDLIYVFANQLIVLENDRIEKQIDYPEDFLATFNSLLVEKTKNGLLIGSKFSDYCYFFINNRFIKRNLAIENTIIQNLSWSDGKNWLCTTAGIVEIDSESDGKRTFFNGTNISYIYKTKNNNYWISTLTEGLYFIEDFDTKLISSDESLTSLCFKNDQLLVGTKNDRIIALDNNRFKTIYAGKDNHQIGQLFFDTYSNQLFFTSSKFSILDTKQHLTEQLAIAVKSVCAIDNKYLAFAASGSSGLFRTNNNITSHWDALFNSYLQKNDLDYSDIIANAKGKAIVYDSIRKIIYFATNNGLFYTDSKGSKSELKHKNKSLSIVKLSFDNGKIYACNGDLKLFQIENNIISEIALPKNIQKKTIEKTILKNKLLFIITNKYIFEFNLVSKTLKQIIHINSDIEVNDVLLKNGVYYISSNRGLILKKEEVYNRTQPVFTIEAVKVNNRIADALKLENLAYDENNIQIAYRFLSPSPFEEHELSYRINTSQWQKADILNPKLVLSSLNHGSYTVEFALNSDFKNTFKMQFTINRPFWLRFPFIFGASLLILSVFFWLYRNTIQKIEKRNKLVLDKVNLEKNLNQSKLKAIKSQMNPHFFYNALNTLQSYILSNEKKQAVDYLSKFSNLTRTILEMTEKETVSVKEEIKTLKLYLDIEKARFENDFNYTITMAPMDADSIKIPSMLLQPYVENAIKHGLLHKQGIKELKIAFELNDDLLKITLDDNGIGRQKSGELNAIKNKNHNSFATAAMQNRIDLLNQYMHKNISILYIDKTNPLKQPLGTTVVFEIPVSY